jgi:hypothetical protein
MQQERVPIYLVIGRITAVLGMSFAAAAAIFFLIGALWVPALVAAVLIVPFAALMPLVESLAGKHARKSTPPLA